MHEEKGEALARGYLAVVNTFTNGGFCVERSPQFHLYKVESYEVDRESRS